MKRTDKKGFTIVELVIVIAVIAILAAVLIPNISRLVRKAQVSNDLSLVRNLNLALETESATMDYPTAYDAFAAVKENGYDIAKIEAKASNNKILYDEVNKCFVYLNGVNLEYYPNSKKGDTATPNHQLWTVVTSAEDAKKSQYSVYWNGGDGATVEVKDVGFDVGVNKNVTVTLTAGDRELTVRTNGGNMKITSDGTINHYGMIEKADLQKVASKSYHEFGYVTSYIKVTSGRIVVEPKASVSIIAVAGDSVSVEQKAGAELFKVAPTGSMTKLDTSKISVSTAIVQETGALDLTNLSYGGGNGQTKDTAFELYTAAHLVAFAKDVNEGKLTGYVYAKLCADVDISGMGWEPIGNAEHPFNGTFDGQNKTVKGLTNKGYTPAATLWGITTTAKNAGVPYGFFGVAGTLGETSGDVVLKNINFTDVDIDSSDFNMVGVLLGADTAGAKVKENYANENYNGKVEISKVTATGSINCSNDTTVGGIVGKIYTKGTASVTDCVNKVAINATKIGKYAGIVGYTSASISFEKCENKGKITVTASEAKNCYVAGIATIGKNEVVTVKKCDNAAELNTIGLVSHILQQAGSTVTKVIAESCTASVGVLYYSNSVIEYQRKDNGDSIWADDAKDSNGKYVVRIIDAARYGAKALVGKYEAGTKATYQDYKWTKTN